MSEPIRIYVACVASYAAGKLHGRWIDVESWKDADDLQAEIDAMFADSPEPHAEEWRIDDHEGLPDRLMDDASLADLCEYAEILEEYDSDEVEAACDVADYGCTAEDFRKILDENYRGCFDHKGDYAAEMCDGVGDIPQHLEMYIDYEAMERDMDLSGDIDRVELNGRVYIFDAH